MTPLSDFKSQIFRKYAGLFVFLVTGALLTSGAVELFFGYQEQRSSLAEIERERAASAALTIEQFIDGIVQQLRGAANNPQPTDAIGLERRRLYFLGLLRHVPALADISYLDSSGQERLRLSRIAVDVIGGQSGPFELPPAQGPKNEDVYFSPVYFRNESEPFMTIAVTDQGPDPGVVLAEVNLKFIWDVISQIRIGETGYVYAVDATGTLVAHPNISLVLKKTDLSNFTQVRTALESSHSQAKLRQAEVMIARDMASERVLTTYQTIEPLGWYLIVEQPLDEAFAQVYASIWRTGFLLLMGIGLSVAASLYLARRIVTPIRALQANAARIGAGELSQSITVDTGDELEELAEEFNRMAFRLRDSYSNLEQKIEERTRNLVNTQQLLTKVVEAQEEERRRIASDLHDSVAQWLVGASYQAQVCVALLDQGKEDELRSDLTAIEETLRTSLKELRQVLAGLRPPALEELGLAHAIRQDMERLTNEGVTCSFEVKGTAIRLPASVEITAFRIAQETLSNVSKHASASEVSLKLAFESDELTLRIRDNGCGFDLSRTLEGADSVGHLGLLGIKQRVDALGGVLQITSDPGSGTEFEIRMPIQQGSQ